jgi:hypothetical protein
MIVRVWVIVNSYLRSDLNASLNSNPNLNIISNTCIEVYCPLGSGIPLLVSEGYYSLTPSNITQEEGEEYEEDSPLTRLDFGF